ncbi:MAG: hypothetical protein OQK07_01145 [Rhodospirillales bacterium]|nr:hypothetical protein [Rhodospirillales bacterium]
MSEISEPEMPELETPEEQEHPEEHAQPEDYDLTIRDGLFEPDPAVNARLREAGFTNEQAQLVYDLAAEVLPEMMADVSGAYQEEKHRDALAEHFGGADRYAAAAKQIAAWGRANLPEAAFDALAATPEGVIALHGMMDAGEPALGAGEGGGGSAPATESDLRRLMADPRYWRDHDPAVVGRVREGYARLYPGR